MKNLILILIIFILTFSEQIYSQKIETPEKMTIKEFNHPLDSKYLFYRNLITFPYKENKWVAGAIDKLFKVRFESYLRGTFNTNDSSILLRPSYYNSKLTIKSIKYFYLYQNKVSVRNLKKSDLKFKETTKGYELDLTTIKRDSNYILELNYAFETDDKQIINFQFENGKQYVDAKIQINIPEIYNYNISYDKTFVLETIEKYLLGPKIGYKGNSGILASYWMEYQKRYDPTIYFTQVNCQTNLYTFTLKDLETSNKNTDLNIILNLKTINEIK